MTHDTFTWPVDSTPEAPTFVMASPANFLPTSPRRRPRFNPTKLLSIVGSLLVVFALVGVIASQQSSLNHARATLASTQSSLKTTTTTLTDTQANLTSTQNQLATANADVVKTKADLATAQADLATAQADLVTANSALGKARADLSDSQGQLSTAKANNSACQQFVAGADSVVNGLNNFIALSTQFDQYNSAGDLVGMQQTLNEMSTSVDGLKPLMSQYKTLKAACFGGAASAPGSNV
jgi:hypothetical protein